MTSLLFMLLFCSLMCSTTIFLTIMNTSIAKLIVLRAHLPEQMAIVSQAAGMGYPVTMYADKLTKDVEKYSRNPVVQTRIGQPMNCTLINDGSIIVHA